MCWALPPARRCLKSIEAMLKRQSAQGLEAIHRSLDSGSDPRQFARQIVDYLRSLLLVAMGNASQVDATAEVTLTNGTSRPGS